MKKEFEQLTEKAFISVLKETENLTIEEIVNVINSLNACIPWNKYIIDMSTKYEYGYNGYRQQAYISDMILIVQKVNCETGELTDLFEGSIYTA